MESDAHDGRGVAAVAEALVDTGLGACAVVSVTGVDGAFFGTDEEVSGIGVREGHAGWGKVFCFGGWGRGQFKEFLGLGEHVDGPAADDTVGGAGDDVICVLRADNVEGVDRVGVAGPGQRRFLNGGGLGACIPEQYLPAVCATHDETGMEGGEFGSQYVGLRVKDVFRTIM